MLQIILAYSLISISAKLALLSKFTNLFSILKNESDVRDCGIVLEVRIADSLESSSAQAITAIILSRSSCDKFSIPSGN